MVIGACEAQKVVCSIRGCNEDLGRCWSAESLKKPLLAIRIELTEHIIQEEKRRSFRMVPEKVDRGEEQCEDNASPLPLGGN